MTIRIASTPSGVLRPGQIFDPVGRALDRVGDRWTLVLVRHLLGGPRGFQELRTRTGIAPRVLSARLRRLVQARLVEPVQAGGRGAYALTDHGRSLEPIVAAIARWWVLHAMEEHVAVGGAFSETSAQSILESLPFLLREDRAAGVDLTFEIRLSGTGGGVWTVRIADAACAVTRGFAERADVRYTADAGVWCGVALGLIDPRKALAEGRLTKDGGREALDRYFHQIPHPSGSAQSAEGSPSAEHVHRRSQRRAR
ncbi:MAG TPA: winged helix-turn-helix transcriptional regulator [Myxococcota bacterium]|nr:winged helix-turn-helix transcriptional regulator [Myxococcota bacterium]